MKRLIFSILAIMFVQLLTAQSLPIVRLTGDFGYEYSEGTVEVVMPDATDAAEVMKAKVKWRGGTTNAEGKHKRNYSIKFLDAAGNKQDRKFFGLRKDNHWILDAGQVDLSRMRNRVATDLWNDFATKPYYYDREPKALTGTRGEFVEVYLNDEYRGIYCMTECIDRSQMKLKKYQETTDELGQKDVTIHGQLWKCGGFQNASFYGYIPYDNTSETWGDIETKYPELEDVSPTDYWVMYDAVRFITDCEWEDFSANVEDYFDMPVYIDYYLFCCLLNAVDNSGGKNIYWACYDAQEDKKLTLAVWDLDCTVGQYYNPTDPHNEIVGPESPLEYHNSASNFTRQFFVFNDQSFFQRVQERWTELRKSHFDVDALKARYHRYFDLFEASGAAEREEKKWSRDSDIGENVLDFAAERKYIDEWLDKRIAFLDKQFISLGITDIQVSQSNRSAIYDLSGRRLPANARLKPGIYIVNGRKVMRN